MLIYYNDIIMKQESRSIFCAGAFMSHHDSALFQKAGTTVLEHGVFAVSTSFILALVKQGAAKRRAPGRDL